MEAAPIVETAHADGEGDGDHPAIRQGAAHQGLKGGGGTRAAGLHDVDHGVAAATHRRAPPAVRRHRGDAAASSDAEDPEDRRRRARDDDACLMCPAAAPGCAHGISARPRVGVSERRCVPCRRPSRTRPRDLAPRAALSASEPVPRPGAVTTRTPPRAAEQAAEPDAGDRSDGTRWTTAAEGQRSWRRPRPECP